MNYILTQVEFLLMPKIPAKFQETEFVPKYNVWLEKTKQVSETLDCADLLKKVIDTLHFSGDLSAVAMELTPQSIEALRLVIELDNDECQVQETIREHVGSCQN